MAFLDNQPNYSVYTQHGLLALARVRVTLIIAVNVLLRRKQ